MFGVKTFLDNKIAIYEALIVFGFTYFAVEYIKSTFVKKSKHVKLTKTENKSSDTQNATLPQDSPPTETKKNDNEEDDDDEDYSIYANGEIRNNYSVFDAPFKMMLCVNMSLNMGKVQTEKR